MSGLSDLAILALLYRAKNGEIRIPEADWSAIPKDADFLCFFEGGTTGDLVLHYKGSSEQ